MVEIIIPVGPNDNPNYLNIVLKSLVENIRKEDIIIIYDNSGKKEIENILNNYRLIIYKIKKYDKINMSKLRNDMIKLINGRFFIMLDSDVIPPKGGIEMLEKTLREGVAYTWMHYAYNENELKKPKGKLENNPNLGCAGLDKNALREIGFFDEKYERGEDIWLYEKLKKHGYKVRPTEGRCLHLNRIHARENFKSSITEARRNLWRPKYDMLRLLDGLGSIESYLSYLYFGSYYIIGILNIINPLITLLYIPTIIIGISYYSNFKNYIYNLIPGLALVLAAPYGFIFAIKKKLIRSLH